METVDCHFSSVLSHHLPRTIGKSVKQLVMQISLSAKYKFPCRKLPIDKFMTTSLSYFAYLKTLNISGKKIFENSKQHSSSRTDYMFMS